MRNLFYRIGIPLVIISAVLVYIFKDTTSIITFAIIFLLFSMGVYDILQHKHAIRKNFPLLGRLRYFFEFISPEIQQYFIERNTDGAPFSRNERALAYQRAKNKRDTQPFGTQLELNNARYEGIKHSMFPTHLNIEEPRMTIGGPDCKQPYSCSILNISAMSYGSLSNNAVRALNLGAKKGGFYHNTGEGSISEYHRMGGDLVWQIGTGYFGCRDAQGNFNPEAFKERAHLPEVKMIEIKLSQGAKPGHGGVLPAIKNTPEVAKIRLIEPGTRVLSPPGHSAFSDMDGMLQFIKQVRDLCDGKPVGIKLCIGRTDEFIQLCEKMIETGIKPDFITIDGAEGGTGAAPIEFADGVGMPIQPALIFTHKTLTRFNLRKDITVIASGKVISAYSILKLIALGADVCNSARGFMFSLGCIQALKCNTNECPAGVATQDKMLIKGLVVKEKKERVYNFHKNTVNATIELMGAAGYHSIEEVDINMFMKGDEFEDMANKYFPDILSQYQDL